MNHFSKTVRRFCNELFLVRLTGDHILDHSNSDKSFIRLGKEGQKFDQRSV